MGCQLVLITYRKSHTGFLLVTTSVTLHALECRNCPYFELLLVTTLVTLHALEWRNCPYFELFHRIR